MKLTAVAGTIYQRETRRRQCAPGVSGLQPAACRPCFTAFGAVFILWTRSASLEGGGNGTCFLPGTGWVGGRLWMSNLAGWPRSSSLGDPPVGKILYGYTYHKMNLIISGFCDVYWRYRFCIKCGRRFFENYFGPG